MVSVAQMTLLAVLAAGNGDTQVNEKSWRESFNCGPNSLYLLMKAKGWSITLEEVRKPFGSIGTQGVSLADIEAAAGALEFDVRVVKTNTEQLFRSGSLPAIVHLDNRAQDVGHFSILLGMGEDPVTNVPVARMLDPVAASFYEMPADEFYRQWSTYAIIAAQPSLFSSWMFTLGIVLLIAAVISSTRTKKPKAQTSTAQAEA